MLLKALTCTLLLMLVACDGKQKISLSDASLQDEPAELYLHTQPDFIPEDLLADFEKETGIKVHHHLFESNEELNARLKNRQTGYDIVVPEASFAKAQIDQGWYQPLDKARLPGLAQTDRRLMDQLAQYDPGNRHLVPWTWSFTTAGIHRAKVAQALGGLRLPDDSWELVFNPTYTRRLKTCGIVYPNSALVILQAALHYLELDPYPDQPEDYGKASSLLAQVRPDVQSFSSSPSRELSENRACIVIGSSSEIGSAVNQARGSSGIGDIDMLLPSSGALASFHTIAIPADAPHPGNAHKFIEFFLRPENAARMITELGFNPGNQAARQLIGNDSANNPSVFLPENYADKLIAKRQVSENAIDAAEQVFLALRRGVESPGTKPH